jgi:hypothetical protein
MLVTQQPVLRRFWYATVPVGQFQDGPRPFTPLKENIVLFLDAEGRPAALADRCCCRSRSSSRFAMPWPAWRMAALTPRSTRPRRPRRS